MDLNDPAIAEAVRVECFDFIMLLLWLIDYTTESPTISIYSPTSCGFDRPMGSIGQPSTECVGKSLCRDLLVSE